MILFNMVKSVLPRLNLVFHKKVILSIILYANINDFMETFKIRKMEKCSSLYTGIQEEGIIFGNSITYS
jgi:hypothetical protein